jgi:hypothetical protein
MGDREGVGERGRERGVDRGGEREREEPTVIFFT